LKEKKMSIKDHKKIAVLTVLLLGLSIHYAYADKSQLQEKLSMSISVKLTDVTIAEALEKIGQEAGLKIVLSDEAIWKLPQGRATRLSVTLEGPLADSLTEMLKAFFMRYAVGLEEITIYPRPELQHILGRPSHEQLELLKKMYTIALVVANRDAAEIRRLITGAFNVLVMPVDRYRLLTTSMSTLVEGLPDGASSPRATLPQLLDSVGQAWYISGPDFPHQPAQIWSVTESEFREAKLDQIVDIAFKDEPAEVIIQRLANWTGMELFVDNQDPGWLSYITSVEMQNVKLRQALRNVVSTVDGDVDFDAAGNNIQVRGPIHERKPATSKATSSRSGDYVGKISIPMDGGKYYIEFMLREGDLTEELKRLRAEKIKEVLGESPEPAEKPK
jgi:hypothetical protein